MGLNVTYLYAYPVDPVSLPSSEGRSLTSKSFLYRKGSSHDDRNAPENLSTVIELKVAHEFPCPLSRQRVVLTTETGFVGR
jgi:hypothetical protein